MKLRESLLLGSIGRCTTRAGTRRSPQRERVQSRVQVAQPAGGSSGEKLALRILQYVIIITPNVASRIAAGHHGAAVPQYLDIVRTSVSGWWVRVSGWCVRLLGRVNFKKWLRFERSTRCQTCKEILFVGRPDPLEKYSAGFGSWYGAPIAVCLGSWRNWWRRKWYHQACCGVDTDRSNLAGAWHVFGFAPSEIQQYRVRALPIAKPLFSGKIAPPTPTREKTVHVRGA